MASIVFPTDFSDVSVNALPWAINMANTLNASIHCLYVVEEPQIYSTLDMGAIAVPTAGELVSSAETRMKAFISEQLAKAPHGVEAKVVIGHAASEIVNYANDANADLIVMTTHGYSGVKHVLLGSTTEDVLRHASCPVLSVRAKKS
jgi:nucleotide-binding universal stress UspA family protein